MIKDTQLSQYMKISLHVILRKDRRYMTKKTGIWKLKIRNRAMCMRVARRSEMWTWLNVDSSICEREIYRVEVS